MPTPTENIATVDGYVELTFRFEREGSKWVGTCLELSTSTYAKTLDRVRKVLPLLVVEHLNLLEEAEERIRFFEEHDIVVWSSAKPESHNFSIPRTDVYLANADDGPLYQPTVFPVQRPGSLVSV